MNTFTTAAIATPRRRRGLTLTAAVLALMATSSLNARAACAACGGHCTGDSELVVHGLFFMHQDETFACVTVCGNGELHTQAHTLTVTGAGGLTIIDGGLLKVDGIGGAITLTGGGTHAIDDRIVLDAPTATLGITTTSGVILRGDGRIEGKHDASKITIAAVDAGVELESEIEIRGILDFTGAGDFFCDFASGCRINIDRAGTLDFALSGTLTDQAGANRWVVNAPGEVLQFSMSANLLGDFAISNGQLKVVDGNSVCTTGAFSHTGGIVVVGGNGTDPEGSFKRASSCP